MKLNIRYRNNWWLISGVLAVVLVIFSGGVVSNVYKEYTIFGINISGRLAYAMLLILSAGVLLLHASWHLWVKILIRKRQKILMRYSHQLGMHPGKIPLSELVWSISEDKSRYHKHNIINSYIGDGWGYGEFTFKRFHKTKHGKVDRTEYFYAIAAFKLPRKLPNVMFDSKLTGGREFKALLDDSQKHSLESIFGKYFDTYFHEDYNIDSLSFITPEVMEAIIEAKEYDVEIHGEYLYLYNELENMPKQLLDMKRLGENIFTKLENNIYSYRDDRIAYSQGRRTVSVLGLNLKKSLTFDYIILTFIGFFIAAVFIVGLTKPEYSQIWLYSGVFLITLAAPRVIKIFRVRQEQKIAQDLRNYGA